jgi:hypothetical protein
MDADFPGTVVNLEINTDDNHSYGLTSEASPRLRRRLNLNVTASLVHGNKIWCTFVLD